MSIAGKIEIKLTKKGGSIFRGIGPLGFKNTFSWSEYYKEGKNSHSKKRKTRLKKNLLLGPNMSKERKNYLNQVFKHTLERVKNGESF